VSESSESHLQEAPEVSRRYAKRVLLVLMVVYVFNFVDRFILSILLQPIKEDLGASDTAMGFLTGIAFALFYTTAGIPIARLADRANRVTVIAIGLAVWSGMTALSGVARSFAQLALARIGVGVGEAACTPAAHSLIADYFPPERRATALATYQLGAPIGIMLGFLAGGWINEAFGWRAAFFVVGLPGVLLAVVVKLVIRELPRGYSDRQLDESAAPSLGDALRVLKDLKSFVHLALGGSLHGLVAAGLSVWNAAFLIRVHGMSTGEVGSWLGPIAGLAGGAGVYLGGMITDRLAIRDARWFVWVPAISIILQIPFALVFYLHPNPIVALVFLIPATVLSSVFAGPIYATAQSLVRPRMRALTAAVLLFLLNLIGLGLGPQLVGVMSDLFAERSGSESLRWALVIIQAVNLWAVVHYLIAARTLRQELRARKEASLES
jgi:predicted MFS family arabinose efflux permease